MPKSCEYWLFLTSKQPPIAQLKVTWDLISISKILERSSPIQEVKNINKYIRFVFSLAFIDLCYEASKFIINEINAINY
jgi:hypothetical protein